MIARELTKPVSKILTLSPRSCLPENLQRYSDTHFLRSDTFITTTFLCKLYFISLWFVIFIWMIYVID